MDDPTQRSDGGPGHAAGEGSDGDLRWFLESYDEVYAPIVVRLSGQGGGSEAVAELAAEVFAQLWRSRDTVPRSAGATLRWALVAADRVVTDRRHRGTAMRTTLADDPTLPAVVLDDLARVRRLVESLPCTDVPPL